MVTVAVVGTGRMGSAMARALARGGSTLILHNRTLDRCVPLAAELGARVAETPAAAAAEADVAITMLADGAAVASVWAGEDGLLAGAHPGAVLIDMSTVPPSTLHPFEARARASGAGILDAPVSGSTALAESGSLTIMAGGEAADLERARPVLDQLARQVFHMGPLGSGSAMKLAVNTMIFGLNNTLAEALVLAERAGVDRALAYEVIANSAAGAPFVGYKRDAFLDPDGTPTAFSLALAEKDLRLITELAGSVGVELPQAMTNLELIRDAAREMGADRDFSAVAVHLRGRTKGGVPG
ncbi:MAG TPA: NAD(P)-dependent oxidoreductase [candidate division Zixibacteria bacterium]|nr:NAD(P)-dependent oxidoreductase [candidate division Zixibacteria bacterium]